MKKAIIDIGSNSVRLYLTDGITDNKYIETTMLVQNAHSGFLDPKSIERTILAIKAFLKTAKAEGHLKTAIFATEAVRSAKNKDVFINRLKDITDIEIDVLSGDEEATIAFLGAAQSYVEKICGVIDIGGASVEYACGQGTDIIYKKSLPIGAIILKNNCSDDRDRLISYIENQIAQLDKKPTIELLIGVSGTLTSLAAMDLDLNIYDKNKVHGHIIKREKLEKLEKVIFSDINLTKRFRTLSEKRSSIIKQGITVILSLLTYFDKNEIIISEKDNLEGYVLYKNL